MPPITAEQDQLSSVKRRLLEKLLRGGAAGQSQEEPLEPRAKDARIPLAPCQQQLWLHAQLNPDAPVYNEPMTVHFNGGLDRDALERAIGELIQRHEIWRTTFAYGDGEVVQIVHDRLPIEIPFHDLTSLPAPEREPKAVRLAMADARSPFDTSVGPLLRARLVKLEENQYRLFLVQHHLIHDGLTIYRVLMSELPAMYDAFAQGKPSPLPAPSFQYADFALWQKRFLDNNGAAEQIAYWRKQLSGEIQPLDLPTDRPRPPVFSFRGGASNFVVPAELAASVRESASRTGVTPFAFMLAAFKTLLFRYTGRQDIVVGVLTDARRRPEFAQMAGFLMNTVPLRTKPAAERTFREYLHEVRDTILNAMTNVDVPMDRLVREIDYTRDPSRHPIFQVMFALEPSSSAPDARWKLTQGEVSSGTTKLDLDFQLEERGGGYAARLTYSADLFDAATIERLFANWRTLLEGAIRDPDTGLSRLPLMTAAETEDLCGAGNANRRDIPACTISELFEAQAARTPNTVAIESGGTVLTYDELNREANRLALRLREKGVGRQTLVALCVERSCRMMVSVLAVLKAGAAYLPLDPDLPNERIQFILEDSQAPLLLTERSLMPILFANAGNGMRIVHSDEGSGQGANLEPLASPEDVAHVLYTSGSTGRPKGVEVPHRSVVNLLQSMLREPGCTAHDRMLSVTTLSFDIAGLELYLPLICGGCVILANRTEVRDPMLLMELIQDSKPTVMQATPATWRALVDADFKGDREMRILCGGEALSRDLAEQLLARSAEVWNMYGPTETTIWSTAQRVTSGSGPVPIGRPIDNTQVYVLDTERRIVPTGVTGELYIGGAGVTRGYLRRPELTAERFVQVEAAGNARLYRTGDLARWRSDGALECLGRVDNQVKIRGFRVELEEIEAVLAQHPGVRAAAVKAWPDASGHMFIAAYVVGDEDSNLRAFLRGKLPDYMVPSIFLSLEQVPLTHNLKIDRQKLPPPELGRERTPYLVPESETERRLAPIWESVLGISSIGIHDDFFHAGGHSLLVPKLLSQVEKTFGRRFPMTSVFEAPTIRRFALLLQDSVAPATARAVSIRSKKNSKRPLAWLYPGSEMRNIIKRLDRDVLRVSLRSSDESMLRKDFSLEEMAAYLVRDLQASQPEGPYAIGGWCDAGVLAFEIASQLRHQGSHVDVLVLLDSVNPRTFAGISTLRRRASKASFHLKRLASLQRGQLASYMCNRFSSMRKEVFERAATDIHSYESRFSRATEVYAPGHYDGRVLVLRPERFPSYRDPLLHWKAVITGEIDLRVVTGDHVSMFEEGANEIAAAISQSMGAADAAREIGAVKELARGTG